MQKRIFITICFFLGLLMGNSHAADYQDFWWNPAMSGMGWNIGQQNNTVVMAWYHYGVDGKSTFLVMAGNLNGNKVEGTLNRTSGQPPQANYNPANVIQVAVGTASLEFTSSNSAVFTYNYDGRSGSINLERFTFSISNLTGVYSGAFREIFSCGENTLEAGPVSFQILHNPSTGSFNLSTEACSVKGAHGPTGRLGQMLGTISCDGNAPDGFEATEISTTGFSLSMRFRTVNGACSSNGILSAIKLN